MQRNPTIRHKARSRQTHIPVHLFVHQPERDSLVSHQRLIVAFRIADVLLMCLADLEAYDKSPTCSTVHLLFLP